MATVYVGSSATDPTAVSGWAGLTDGDRVIFAEGSQTITAHASMSNLDTAGKNLNKLQFASTWTGTIGSDSEPFIANCSNGSSPMIVYDAGGGAFYYKPRSGGTASLIKAIRSGTLNLVDHSGTITQLEQTGSVTTNIADGAPVTNLYMDGGQLNAEYNATAFTVATIMGGTANIQRGFTTLSIGSSANVKVYSATTSGTVPTATTVYVYGGKLDWRGGNITTLYAFSPVDFSNVRNAATVTNLYVTPLALAQSKWYSPYATMTYTNVTIYGSARTTV